MQTITRVKGWSEITTKHINITDFCKNNTHFNNTVEQWIASNKRINLYHKRKTCNCCKRKWKEITGNIHFIMTDKVNKIVCDDCFDKLGGND